MKERLRELLPKVLAETGIDNEASLNAKIGDFYSSYIDTAAILLPALPLYAALHLLGARRKP